MRQTQRTYRTTLKRAAKRLGREIDFANIRLFHRIPRGVRQIRDPHAPITGLGDRLCVLIRQLSLARALDCKVVTFWAQPVAHHERAKDRAVLTDIRKFLSFPNDLALEDDLASVSNSKGYVLPSMTRLRVNGLLWDHGFSLVPEIQHGLFQSIGLRVDRTDYLQHVEDVCRSIRPRFHIPHPGEPFLALHLRRGGKTDSTVEVLNFETERQIGLALRRFPHVGWIVFSDDDEAAMDYRAFITAAGGRVLPLSETLDTALAEMFQMSRAAGIIQSSPGSGSYGGWSSFSYVPALIGKVPVLACSPIKVLGPCRYHNYMRANEGRMIEGVYLNSETDAFLDRLVARIG